MTSSFITSAFATDPQPHTPFTSVLFRDFDAWDTNHDGTLSPDEIDHIVRDPAVTGDDAAAAASITLAERGKSKPVVPLTKQYFADYEKRSLAKKSLTTAPADAIDRTVDTDESTTVAESAARHGKKEVDFDLYFTASKQRIARGAGDPLTGRFILDHTRQGPLGDCFFVASISSMMIRDPARLEKLIEPAPAGGYLVKLPATQPIQVPPLTQTELALSSTTAGDGTWLAIMEQAFGKYRARLKGHDQDIDGTEVLRKGGDSAPTIAALTGHKTERLAFGKTMEYRQAHADTMLPKIREALKSAIADHRLVTAGMNPPATQPGEDGTPPPKLNGTPVKVPPDINVGHVYAIVSYDPATDLVEIWNPHGQQFQPKGSPGIQNGFVTEHGRFKLPHTEAYQFYTSFTFEQGH